MNQTKKPTKTTTRSTTKSTAKNSKAVAKRDDGNSLAKKSFEDLVLSGDLSVLSPEEKARYYVDVCHAVGLNPVTQPFLVIKLNGKELLYAGKKCCEQLRKLHKISITDVNQEIKGEFVITLVKGVDRSGRVDSDTSALVISGMTKADRANALMKGVTKAKNRLTLSLAGLGMLDQSEVDDIPNAVEVARIDIETTVLDSEKKGSGSSKK